jgi:RNA polymerase sigma factor (sigma-70 family)
MTEPQPASVALFDDYFRAHYARAVTVATRVLGSRAEAEDTAQDVFATLMRDGVDLPPGPLLYARVVRRALNARRSTIRRAARELRHAVLRRPLLYDGDEPAASLETREQRASLARALRRLNRRDATVLVLRYSADCTYGDIAGALGLPLAHVGTIIARAERALFKEIHHDDA